VEGEIIFQGVVHVEVEVVITTLVTLHSFLTLPDKILISPLDLYHHIDLQPLIHIYLQVKASILVEMTDVCWIMWTSMLLQKVPHLIIDRSKKTFLQLCFPPSPSPSPDFISLPFSSTFCGSSGEELPEIPDWKTGVFLPNFFSCSKPSRKQNPIHQFSSSFFLLSHLLTFYILLNL
jgi:hypothetical protein